MEVKSEPVPLEVKPLPPSAPPQFSGAIGNFTMTTEAKPTNLQVGDPITVTSTVSGRGNFDRVNAPVVEDDRGWHKYPPSSKFNRDDEVGISGAKTFEMVVSANEKKANSSIAGLFLFRSRQRAYVTLRSEPVSIRVQEGGTSNVAATQAASPAPAATARTGTPTAPVAEPQDILYQLTDVGRPRNHLLRFILSGFSGSLKSFRCLDWSDSQVGEFGGQGSTIARLGGLRRCKEAAELMHNLHRSDSSPREYYAGASRMVRLKTALASGGRPIDPNVVDVETAAVTFQLASIRTSASAVV